MQTRRTVAPASPLTQSRRIVVKVGSALLVGEDGAPDAHWLAAFASDLARVRHRGQQVLVVSSGAVALGRRRLGLSRRTSLPEKQAAAAAGQSALMRAWEEALEPHGFTAAQVLLTRDDTEVRHRWLNARATLDQLLELGAIPVINENDTVVTEEIRYGDNDRLAARVAQMVGADVLVLLSDIDGLYTADPRRDPTARHLGEVHEITAEIEAMGGEAPPGYSSGGMVTKLVAGKIALAAGCRMAIARGKDPHPLKALGEGAPCTWFVPHAGPKTARKRWIAGALAPLGTLVVDDGAATALRAGKSLLPAGVRAVEGGFDRGDPVIVRDLAGGELARGLSAYSAADLDRIKGHRSAQIEAILGFRGRDEAIHRDDLVLSGAGG